MSERNDGGPAYPVPCQDDRDCGPRFESGYGGMSLRDAMALSVHMPDEYSNVFAAELLGEASPEDGDDIADHIDFWMRAEAAYRYAMADAMLAARERS